VAVSLKGVRHELQADRADKFIVRLFADQEGDVNAIFVIFTHQL
jgi:hypothetical protein